MIDEKAVIKDIQEWSKEREIKWTTESVIALLEAAPSLGNLRPCKVTIVRDIVVGLLGIKEEKEEHNAYFHRWNVDTTDEGDILSAVVEYEDGSIHFVKPWQIKFTDRQKVNISIDSKVIANAVVKMMKD